MTSHIWGAVENYADVCGITRSWPPVHSGVRDDSAPVMHGMSRTRRRIWDNVAALSSLMSRLLLPPDSA
eukprot:1749667-Karenia_brevis.AAC.1